MSLRGRISRWQRRGVAWLGSKGWAERAAWVLAATAVVLGGWVGNVCQGIWSSADWGRLAPWDGENIRVFWAPLALFLLTVGAVYTFRLHLARARTRYLATDSDPRPRPCLVLFLSAIGRATAVATLDAVLPQVRDADGGPATPLLGERGDLGNDIEALRRAKDDPKPGKRRTFWSWEMPLRAIRHNLGLPHRPILNQVILIGSDREERPHAGPGGGERFGSVFQAGAFEQLLRRYGELEHVQVQLLVRATGLREHQLIRPSAFDGSLHRGFDFESFDQLADALLDLLDILAREGVPEHHLVIDLTGGQKPTSVAAAAVTLNRAVETQYVRTNPDYEVIGYDIVFGSRAEL